MSILFLLSIASALLVTSSFPPFDLGIVAWFGLAPLLFALRQRGLLAAGGSGFVFGCLFGIGAFYWANSLLNPSQHLVMLIGFGLYFLVFGFLYRLVSISPRWWVLLGAPALWVGLEYTRSNLFFLSFPWNLLGHSQYHYLTVIQIADITGVYGISFLLVMVNQFLSRVPELLAMRRVAPTIYTGRSYGIDWAVHLLMLALVVVLIFTYGSHKLAASEASGHLRIALVQANLITRAKMSPADQVEHLRAYEQLTREAAKADPDIIVWPATSLPAPIRSSRFVQHKIRKLAYETRSYLLVGGAGSEKFGTQREGYLPYSNSEFLISPFGRLEAQYNKIRLVPFDEYLPLDGKIKWPRWITTLEDGYVPGKEYTLFQVSGAKFGAPICWENMFPDLFRRFVMDGAQFMVSVTNEGFLGRTPAPYQTLASNVFRAVENRVEIVRAAVTGISGFISPNGEVVERVRDKNGSDLFVSGVLVRDVSLSNKKTFYTVYGDIFAYAVICMAALNILVSLSRPKMAPPSIEKRA